MPVHETDDWLAKYVRARPREVPASLGARLASLAVAIPLLAWQPYSAAARELEVHFPSSGVVLAGALALPPSPGKRLPAAVFVSGDGPQDRDGGLGRTGIFHVLAESLVARGIVVLRHDDRGAGSSSAAPGPPSYRALLGDTRAALAFVRRRSEVDPARVVLIGHSEGAKTCEVLAAEDQRIAGIVLLGGATAVNVDSLLEEQARLNPGGPAAHLLPTLARAKAGEQAQGSADLTDWMREHLELPPRSLLPRIRCPVFIAQGGADHLVREHHAHEAAALLVAGGNPDVLVHVFPELSHAFNHWTPGTRHSAEVDAADPVVTRAIAEWVLTKVSARKHP